jgi:hypothetical protein
MRDDVREAIVKAVKTQATARPKPKTSSHRHRRTSAGLWVRPFHSDALGVNPEQIPEARAAMAARGVPVDFTADGQCILTSENHFRKVAEARGIWTGRDGYAIRDGEGRPEPTGKDREREKDKFRRAVARGDYD